MTDRDIETYLESFEGEQENDSSTVNIVEIKKKMAFIKREVNKPHNCTPACLCKAINISIDLLDMQIKKLGV